VRTTDRIRRPRPTPDWKAIEVDYRSGGYSLRELARRHGCDHSSIANRAARHGWRRGEDSPDATPAPCLREQPLQQVLASMTQEQRLASGQDALRAGARP